MKSIDSRLVAALLVILLALMIYIFGLRMLFPPLVPIGQVVFGLARQLGDLVVKREL